MNVPSIDIIKNHPSLTRRGEARGEHQEAAEGRGEKQ